MSQVFVIRMIRASESNVLASLFTQPNTLPVCMPLCDKGIKYFRSATAVLGRTSPIFRVSGRDGIGPVYRYQMIVIKNTWVFLRKAYQ